MNILKIIISLSLISSFSFADVMPFTSYSGLTYMIDLNLCKTGFDVPSGSGIAHCDVKISPIVSAYDLLQLEQKMHDQFQQIESDRQDDIVDKVIEKIKKDPKLAQEILKAAKAKQ